MVFVNIETAGTEQRPANTKRLTAAMIFACVAVWLCLSVPAMQAQSSPSQTPSGQSQAPQTQPAQNQNNDIPDAPTVQPPSETPAPPPIPKAGRKKAGRERSVDESADRKAGSR